MKYLCTSNTSRPQQCLEIQRLLDTNRRVPLTQNNVNDEPESPRASQRIGD
jgi:hypothetical protein